MSKTTIFIFFFAFSFHWNLQNILAHSFKIDEFILVKVDGIAGGVCDGEYADGVSDGKRDSIVEGAEVIGNIDGHVVGIVNEGF